MHITSAVTLGGVTTGTALLIIYGTYWWHREKHRPRTLIPVILAIAYGMLITLSGGGLLGWGSRITLWGGNQIGDKALSWGVGGTTMDVTRAHQLVLDPGGHVVVLLLTVTLVCIARFSKKLRSWKLLLGLAAGICLALSGTVAGAAAMPLGSSVNALGAVFTQEMAS
ncbi:hypothetical protein [Actinacidiphila sp. ITFR-21]|uniref:hypothetical protein n=1 Tax=Actinacidiphila sp. ITFR-21 TaxID=3075199 RepID=UPI00288BCC5E|nr:hypothetical protein [Streptomyces sp. ITFR-21]WNI16926.1 hypothetical protein RLT57_16280 [Streptomyces sp. ITFR-21]